MSIKLKSRAFFLLDPSHNFVDHLIYNYLYNYLVFLEAFYKNYFVNYIKINFNKNNFINIFLQK